MEFGPVPLAAAKGAILAHSQAVPGGRLRKGKVLEPRDIDQLRAAGLKDVVVARFGPGELGEDAAAQLLGAALAGPGVHSAPATGGRVNLFATRAGVLEVARQRVLALNRIAPMITLATLPEWAETSDKMLVATVKIIAYAVDKDALQAACKAAKGALTLHQPMLHNASLIQTGVPGKLTEKGRRALAARLGRFGAAVRQHEIVAHDGGALTGALGRATGEVVFILTASATSDIRDVAPESLRLAGGHVHHFGMPVDPGNLLFIGELSGRPVIGLPGCARSTAKNGADWVIARIVCGLPVTSKEIAEMGVGGLLKEMPSRPQPREK